MWNNLRARHYSVLILLAIVALETSAIAIDRFINREGDVAFAIESPYQNNQFIQNFKVAEASCKKVPAVINVAPKSTPVAQQNLVAVLPVPEIKPIEKTVKTPFVAASNQVPAEKVYVEYAIQPGDSLSHIAKLFGSETDLIKKANELNDKHVIKAGETLKVPLPASEMTYTVKPGDSLSKIASKFRIPLEKIIEHNALKSHLLQQDQKLHIPVKKIDRELKLVSNREAIKKADERLAKIDSEKPELIKSQSRFEPVRMNRIQMAQAPAVKPDIKFIEKELLTSPPAISRPTNTARAEVNSSVAVLKNSPATDAQKSDVPESANKNDLPDQIVYTVCKGDSLLKISQKFNTNVAQIKEENNLKSNLLKVGEQLKISPEKKLFRVTQSPATKKAENAETTIVTHKVKKGESLSLIARKYSTTISAIIAENQLSSSLVTVGQALKVPTNKKNFRVAKTSSVTQKMMRMPTRGRLSDRYGWRNHPVYRKRLFHAGIDIAAPKGAPINAAMAGKVIYAGRRSGYGKLVIISHESGYSTRYAHCSTILVKKGQTVKAGQLVARVGATGVATGNHLHFEVRKNGKTLNPLSYLK